METQENNLTKTIKSNTQDIKPIVNYAGPIAPLVAQVFYDAGFQSSFGNQTTVFNINYGSPKKLPGYRYYSPYQYINQIPGSFSYTRKDILAESIKRQNYTEISPESYMLPNDLKELEKAMNNSKPNDWFIYKPALAARGESIQLIHSLKDIEDTNTQAVVQKYIDNPLLFQGRKIDFRIYFAITSVDPFIVYVYDDFIGRLASKKYKSITKQNFKQFQMHLTNSAVNKKTKNHKMDWESVFGDQQTQEKIKQQIHDILIKTLISSYPQLIIAQQKVPEQYDYPRHYFSYYGADIMFTDDLQGKIIEINASPSLNSDSDDDYKLKRHMLTTLLNMIGLQVQFKDGKLYKPKLNFNQNKTNQTIQNEFTIQNIKNKLNQTYEHTTDQTFMNQNNFNYEIRAIKQLTDEESRKDQKWTRIFPLSPENQKKYSQFVNMTYLNSLLHKYIQENEQINKQQFKDEL